MSRPFLSLACIFLAVQAPVAGQSTCPSLTDRFGPPGTDGVVRDVIVFDDGTGPAVYAGGVFSAAGEARSTYVARFDGTRWSRVGDMAPGSSLVGVDDLEVFDDGTGPRLYATGPGIGVARWNGQAWEHTYAGLQHTLKALAVYDAGAGPRLYVGGSSGTFSNERPWLGRLEGTTWVQIQGSPDVDSPPHAARIDALCVYDEGSGPKLFVGGVFDNLPGTGGAQSFSLARFDGTSWSVVGPSGVGGVVVGEGVHSLAVFDDGTGERLYLAGDFRPFPGAAVHNLARWDGTSFSTPPVPVQNAVSKIASVPAVGDVPAGVWLSGAFALAGGSKTCVWNSGGIAPVPGCTQTTLRAMTAFDSGSGPEAVIGGEFHAVDNVAAWNVARRSGGAWHSTFAGEGATFANLYDEFHAFLVHDDGSGPALYAAGSGPAHAGDQSIGAVARWNGSSWSALGILYGTANSLASFDFGDGMQLVAAGSLAVNGQLPGIMFGRWNGTSWATLPTPIYFTPYALAVFDAGEGPRLYVGGSGVFGGLLRWNGSAWEQFPCMQVRTLLVHDDGSGPALFVGGRFNVAGAFGSPNLMRFDGTSFFPVGAGVGGHGGTPTNEVRSLVRFDDGHGVRLVAGGTFATASGVPARNVACWNGSAWSALSLGLSVDTGTASVKALAVVDEGAGNGPALYAGGAFTKADLAPARGVARWDGTGWSEAFGGAHGLFGGVETMLSVEHDAFGGRVLFVGGGFSGLGEVGASRIAEFRACDATGELGCFGDGSAAACPCGNSSAPSERAGCMHSLGHGGALRARGRPSLTADTIELQGSAMPDVGVLYFHGMSELLGGFGVPFGDGIKCTGGPFVRLSTKVNTAGASSYPGPGDPSVSVKGMIHVPGTRHYQLRYRNAAAFCTSDTFNYTNALTLVWTP